MKPAKYALGWSVSPEDVPAQKQKVVDILARGMRAKMREILRDLPPGFAVKFEAILAVIPIKATRSTRKAG